MQSEPSKRCESWLEMEPEWILRAMQKRLTELETLASLLMFSRSSHEGQRRATDTEKGV